MNYYNYDKNDIAKSIKQAMDNYAKPEVVAFLLGERNKKIDENEGLEQHKNDEITRSANAYINSYYGENNKKDIDALYQERRDIAAKNLEAASQKSLDAYKAGISSNNNLFADVRRGIYSAYRRGSLGNEEVLAAGGLGRGISNKVSSGFGESSRMAQNTTYQNNIADSYAAQNKSANEIANQYAQGVIDAQKEYNKEISQIAGERIQQANDEREYKRAVDADMLKRASFESDEEQRAFENSITMRKLESDEQKELFEQAYKLFAGAGVVTNQYIADILGIPVGTKYWQYVIGQQNASTAYLNYTVNSRNASTAATKAQNDYEIDKINADTKAFEAETDRIELRGEY